MQWQSHQDTPGYVMIRFGARAKLFCWRNLLSGRELSPTTDLTVEQLSWHTLTQGQEAPKSAQRQKIVKPTKQIPKEVQIQNTIPCPKISPQLNEVKLFNKPKWSSLSGHFHASFPHLCSFLTRWPPWSWSFTAVPSPPWHSLLSEDESRLYVLPPHWKLTISLRSSAFQSLSINALAPGAGSFIQEEHTSIKWTRINRSNSNKLPTVVPLLEILNIHFFCTKLLY